MTLPSKPIMIRLPAELSDRFERLKAEFPGLPQSLVLRLLVSSILEKSLDEQIDVVTAQIRQGKDASNSSFQNRIVGLNSKGRRKKG